MGDKDLLGCGRERNDEKRSMLSLSAGVGYGSEVGGSVKEARLAAGEDRPKGQSTQPDWKLGGRDSERRRTSAGDAWANLVPYVSQCGQGADQVAY